MRVDLPQDRCQCERPTRVTGSVGCGTCSGNLPPMTPREQFRLSFKTAWMKVGVEVEGVTVGVLFTDTQEWNPLPVFSALTRHEKAGIFAELGRQHILTPENVKWLTETWETT